MLNLFEVIQEVSEVTQSACADLQGLSATVMTLKEHDGVFLQIIDGDLPEPGAVRLCYERLVRDEKPVKAELSKLTIKELEKKTHCFRKEKKPDLIDSVYETMLTSYGFLTVVGEALISTGYTLQHKITGMRKRLADLNPAHLENYRSESLARRAKSLAHIEAVMKAINNPETLEEFKKFIHIKGASKFSPEQQIRYDELLSESMKATQDQELAAKAKVDGVTVDAEVVLIETKHTRDLYDLFVVRLDRRVEKEEFNRLNTAAKRLGGWYSSFKGAGATPGFQFKVKADAEQFMVVCGGDSVDTSDKLEERKQESQQGAVERLRTMADRLYDSASAKLNADRKTNTAKRASQASHTESAARSDIALAQTMRNLADAIDRGDAKHLDRLREKAQVEMFVLFLNRAKNAEICASSPEYSDQQRRKGEPATMETIMHINFPNYVVHAHNLESTIQSLKKHDGTIRHCDRLSVLLRQVKMSNIPIDVPAELAEALCHKFANIDYVLPWSWSTSFTERKRLAKMGISTPEQLRAACREFLQYRSVKQAVNKAVELERALIGKKVGIDFFPTPKALARRMVQIANVRAGQLGAEPQAGNGNIAEAIREAGVEPEVCEISSQLRDILVAKKFNVVGWDFLDLEDKQYDFIIANPPFGNNADITHTRHAYSLLADKGVLVTIVGEGAFFRTGSTETLFRQWLDEIGADVEPLPAGTFTDSSLMVNTGTNARLVTIFK